MAEKAPCSARPLPKRLARYLPGLALLQPLSPLAGLYKLCTARPSILHVCRELFSVLSLFLMRNTTIGAMAPGHGQPPERPVMLLRDRALCDGVVRTQHVLRLVRRDVLIEAYISVRIRKICVVEGRCCGR